MKVPVVTDDRLAQNAQAKIGFDPASPTVFRQDFGNIALLEVEMRLPLQHSLGRNW